MQPVTDAQFKAVVLEAELPVLVDFWAVWCAPCTALAPLLESMAEDYEGRMAFTKLDVDANAATAQAWGVKAFPQLIVFHKGAEVARSVGALSRSRLAGFLDDALSKAVA